ncbi:MAG: nicotinamide mononucleotide transporter [Clostridia bacterium]|nr:nicotinamide mononucleotide transporter [Clostridia bacterium]
MKKNFFRENLPLAVGLVLTAIGISAAAIVFHQQLWRILPLYVSLAVALLQSRMNRLAPLLGGINSVLYAAVYCYYALYGSAAYALLVSCPVQIATFIRWSKKPWGDTTVFKKLSVRQRVILFFSFAASYAALTPLLTSGGRFVLLDSAITLLGVLSALLMMLSFREYAPVTVLGVILSAALYILMLADTPEQTTYLVFNLYSLVCTSTAAVRIRRVCAEQDPSGGSAS